MEPDADYSFLAMTVVQLFRCCQTAGFEVFLDKFGSRGIVAPVCLGFLREEVTGLVRCFVAELLQNCAENRMNRKTNLLVLPPGLERNSLNDSFQ